MRKLVISASLFSLLYGAEAFSQSKQIYLSPEGEEISSRMFYKYLRTKDSLYTKWEYIDENGQRIGTLNKNLYLKGNHNHLELLQAIKNITGREYPANTIFLLGYNFYKDLCTGENQTDWSKKKIAERKRILNPQKEQIEKAYENVIYLECFSNHIALQNDQESSTEYFFKDIDYYLIRNFFRTPTSCGSYLLAKPNGQHILRNGEHRPDWMAQLLTHEKWQIFFPDEGD